MTTRKPLPGEKVRGSETGRPTMALLDLLGRRQTLRVLWELRGGELTFRELQSRCDNPSPTVLNKRLAELRAGYIVEHTNGKGYGLTKPGKTLLKSLAPLAGWAEKWEKLIKENK
ncbi:winged helix-turn-helix transcriptional regulator [Aurantivibrio infirmus]